MHQPSGPSLPTMHITYPCVWSKIYTYSSSTNDRMYGSDIHICIEFICSGVFQNKAYWMNTIITYINKNAAEHSLCKYGADEYDHAIEWQHEDPSGFTGHFHIMYSTLHYAVLFRCIPHPTVHEFAIVTSKHEVQSPLTREHRSLARWQMPCSACADDNYLFECVLQTTHQSGTLFHTPIIARNPYTPVVITRSSSCLHFAP